MRKIKHFDYGLRKATIYFDSEWKEYTVKFVYEGKSFYREDYYTTDYEDAVGTSLYYCNNY